MIGSDFFSRWILPSDVLEVAFWAAAFTLASWAIFVIPAVLYLPSSSKVFRLPSAPILGGLWILLAFLLLVGIWTGYWASPLLLGYAAVVGASAGSAYSVLLRRRAEGDKAVG